MNMPTTSNDHDTELVNLRRRAELVEARVKLAEMERQLAESEAGLSELREPWWRSKLTITTLTALVAAIIPATAQIQSWRDQALKQKELNFNIREKYFSAVVQDARREKRVLDFIISTAEDAKILKWAAGEITGISQRIGKQDEAVALRKKLYFEAMGVVADLADDKLVAADREKKQERFWQLYERDLLPVESVEVERLMVKIGREVPRGTKTDAEPPTNIDTIQQLSYELARQMKAELKADSLVSPAADTKSD